MMWRHLANRTLRTRTYSTSNKGCIYKEGSSVELQAFAKQHSLTPSLVTQALTHKSYLHASCPTQERFASLGKRVLNLHIAEDAVRKQNFSEKKIENARLFLAGKKLGIDNLIRWKPASSDPNSLKGQETVVAYSVKAIVGAIYHEKGSVIAREFVQQHILNESD
ncbi:mitochondrial 54S ribosomal protein mL57 [Calcarisporiella thermophila]|uniref:mitochondrial 54S ribosomal protein mL57 n=1 Tax=Calcarisporiella thermophila TaxID=911321 RepID=UPI0037444373